MTFSFTSFYLSFYLPRARRRATAFLIFTLFLLVSPHSYAQDDEAKSITVPTGQFEDLKHTRSGRVDKIIDGLTILLKDKKIIRLASLDIPDFNNNQEAPYNEAAQKLLQSLLPEGTEVMMYQTRVAKKGRVNRMNHQLGHIVTKKGTIWINGALLSHGLARVYTAPKAPEMNTQMLAAEQAARKTERGMWTAESKFPVLTPDDAEQAMGNLAIIEGVVQKTATVKNKVYLNFGKNWKTDFTVMIPPSLRKKLAHNGIDPLSMAHKAVRVRGYLREYNGPLIELEAPEHLEYPLDLSLISTGEKPSLEPIP
jgi:endonuclease YncB( thermonuclease family)